MHEDAEMTHCKTHCNTDLSGIAFSVDQSEETSEARSSQEGEIGSLWSFLCPRESFTVFIILHTASKIKLWRLCLNDMSLCSPGGSSDRWTERQSRMEHIKDKNWRTHKEKSSLSFLQNLTRACAQ